VGRTTRSTATFSEFLIPLGPGQIYLQYNVHTSLPLSGHYCPCSLAVFGATLEEGAVGATYGTPYLASRQHAVCAAVPSYQPSERCVKSWTHWTCYAAASASVSTCATWREKTSHFHDISTMVPSGPLHTAGYVSALHACKPDFRVQRETTRQATQL